MPCCSVTTKSIAKSLLDLNNFRLQYVIAPYEASLLAIFHELDTIIECMRMRTNKQRKKKLLLEQKPFQ